MFVGTQVFPEEVFERGAGELLDEARQLSRVNTAMVFFHTLNIDMYRQRGQAAAGESQAGRAGEKVLWVRSDEAHYQGTPLRYPPAESSVYDGRDAVDELLEAAGSRGMAVYARSLEPYMITRRIAGLSATAEIDLDERLAGHPCFHHPDYRNFVLATYEDLIVQHPRLAGIKFGQERGGPLHAALRGEAPTCFCDRCRALLTERGYDVTKARAGYRAIRELGLSADRGADRPPDGWMACILRAFMRHPDMLAHNQLWYDARESHRKQIFGLARTLSPSLRVGWHIDHHWCWDLLGRACIDFADMPAYTDWLSLALYFDAAGKRMAGHVRRGIASPLLGDLPTDLALDVYRHMVGQDPSKEPALEAMEDQAPLSADHVYAETKRAVDRVAGRCDVYARVGFDLPMYECNTTPEQVADAVRSALRAGADGLFVAREFGEAKRDNLAAVGRVVDEWTADRG
jgi:hypothetical protein